MLASTVQTPTLQTYLRPDLQHLFYSHLPSFWKGSCQPCAKWIPVFPKYTAAGMKWGRTFGSQSLGCFASATVQWKQPDFGVWPFFRYEDCVCFRHCYLDFVQYEPELGAQESCLCCYSGRDFLSRWEVRMGYGPHLYCHTEKNVLRVFQSKECLHFPTPHLH